MNYKELLEKYNILLSENSRLTEENNRLKAQLGTGNGDPCGHRISKPPHPKKLVEDDPAAAASFSDVTNSSDTISKIRLFMSLFKGRDDVYAQKWENKKKDRFSGRRNLARASSECFRY